MGKGEGGSGMAKAKKKPVNTRAPSRRAARTRTLNKKTAKRKAVKTQVTKTKSKKAATPKAATPKAAPVKAKPQAAAKKTPPAYGKGDYVVYPAHGVGKITAVENQKIAGHELKVFVIKFPKEKMTLRVPVAKAENSGLRKLSSREEIRGALKILRGKARIRRTMWSRRAQEYEMKINSGDPLSIAEVLRDLHRNVGQPDQSYSERQIYELAFERLCREVAAVEDLDETGATQKIEDSLKAA